MKGTFLTTVLATVFFSTAALAGQATQPTTQGPIQMTNTQMDQVVAGRYMDIYQNIETGEWVLKPDSGPGSTLWTFGQEGDGNWTYYGTCSTAHGGCSAYEGYY